ncbi:hypothetical protein D3C71_1911080 [compost metagenome]
MIFEGDFPSCVAVDISTGEVFLVSIRGERFTLVEFGCLNVEQLRAFLNDLNDKSPYNLGINPEAMYDYIDGSEGLNYLKKNVFVQFNCLVPILVSPNKGVII